MIGRLNFHFDPPATRQDRAEAWGWQQAQDVDTARRTGRWPAPRPRPTPDGARCLACAMPMTPPAALVRRCTHCGRTAPESTALPRRTAA